jgi:transcriptional regulator with XRE-family HTH domain
MSHGGDVLKRFRRARHLSLEGLQDRSETAGHRISASQIGKVERGERRLSDDVFEALASALELTDDERAQVEAARAGTGAVDVVEQMAALERRLLDELVLLRGELRASTAMILDTLARLRDTRDDRDT